MKPRVHLWTPREAPRGYAAHPPFLPTTEKTLQQDALKQYLDGGMKESSVVYQVTNGSKSPRNL